MILKTGFQSSQFETVKHYLPKLSSISSNSPLSEDILSAAAENMILYSAETRTGTKKRGQQENMGILAEWLR